MMGFLDFCRAHGVLIDTLPPIGIWRRYKTEDKPGKRNGAVKYMGDHGFCQNHATMTSVELWQSGDAAQVRAPTAAELAARELRKQQEREYRLRAIRGAREQWAQAHPPRALHPYLERKGLSAVGTNALRVHGDALIVPVFWRDRLMSIQSITPDGQKRFWTGAPVKGGALVLDRPRAALTAVCEGLATGLAVYQSVRHASVIVAFDAGNLTPVIDRIRPTGNVVICADNDHATQARIGVNPGIQKAENAAELIGAGVAYPQGISGTDWADALAEWGAESARRIERLILSGARYVMT